MATIISEVVRQAATAATEQNDLPSQLKKDFASSLSKNLEKSAAQIKEEISKNKTGDSFNKTVEENTEAVTNKAKNSLSPYLKQRVNSVVSSVLQTEEGRSAVTTATDKYIDNCVEQICSSVESKASTIEEYRIYAEAAIRAFHNTLNNDPELREEIKNAIEEAAQNAAVSKATDLLQPLTLSAQGYITNISQDASSLVEEISHTLTSYDFDSIIKNAATSSIESISSSIANNTFGKLADLPIVGSYFKELQSVTEKAISTAGTSWYQQELTKISKYTQSIKDFQDLIEKNRQVAEAAITKAQNEARKYTEELENKVINEIKKYINLDNFSIGGFKL